MTRILVVDNYDSFVYTIVGYLEQLGADCTVVRNDAVPATDAGGLRRRARLPRSGHARGGRHLHGRHPRVRATRKPMFGVCLGHQALAVVAGATVGRAPELLHGKTSLVHHDGTGVLEGLPARSRRRGTTP